MKRVFDIVGAALALVLLLPIMILISCAIRLFDGRPVFFLQERVGRFGRPFTIYKFRTMRESRFGNSADLTVAGDKRITTCGSILRQSKLDELPQLLNVIMGDMSFVGPRPEVKKYVEKYTPAQQRVLRLRPGITDVASIIFAQENQLLSESDEPEQLYIHFVMPEKIRLNLEYAAHANVFSDILVILRTVVHVLRICRRPVDLATLLVQTRKGNLARSASKQDNLNAAA